MIKSVLATLLALAIISGAGCARGPGPHQLAAKLRHDLPVGTPSAKINAYLTAHGWMHGYLPQEHQWLAGVRDVGSRLSFTREDLAVKIDLDRNNRLKSITVTPVYTYHGKHFF